MYDLNYDDYVVIIPTYSYKTKKLPRYFFFFFGTYASFELYYIAVTSHVCAYALHIAIISVYLEQILNYYTLWVDILSVHTAVPTYAYINVLRTRFFFSFFSPTSISTQSKFGPPFTRTPTMYALCLEI